MCRIQLGDLRGFLSISINFYRITIDHTFFLVFIDHIGEVVVRKKVGVDQPVAWHIVLLFPAHLLHFIIVDSYVVFIPYVFINEKITRDLSNNFKINPPAIVTVRLGIHNFLRK